MLHLRRMAFLLGLCCCMAQAQEPVRGLASFHVPEGFTVEVAATHDLTAYPMFMAYDLHGRLFIAESSGKDLSGKEMVAAPECQILMLQDLDNDGFFDKRSVYADKLSLPMGVQPLGDYVYTCSPPDLLRFKDTDGDGVADLREVVLTGWNVLNTASLHGPYLGPDGWLYLTHGRHGYKINTRESQTLEGQAARIWRCRPDGSGLERVCGGGFDNPVEMVFTGGGEMIGTMTYFTDPRQGQRDALMHWVEGGVYPKPHEVLEEFTRTGDLLPPLTRFARIAPAGLAFFNSDSFGEEYIGNLFSAQFNPHRLQRHKLTRQGASFSSEDADFLTSTDPDFHPTDLLEDPDGSLLFTDTGGWYVDACPISRVAKPEVKGSIYRIRRVGATPPEDPWGKQIDIESAGIPELISLLQDPRPKVQDKASGALLSKDWDVTQPLYDLLHSHVRDGVRLRAMWLLHQRPASPLHMMKALEDPMPQIRMSACRFIGQDLITDEAAERVAALLKDPEPPVRLAAATALARMGAKAAGPMVLAACAGETDPFLQHAYIYALIATGNLALYAGALDNPEAGIRRAALIAADQRGYLDRDSFKTALSDADPAVRAAAVWIATRHPDWEKAVAGYLQEAIAQWTPDANAGVEQLLDAFSAGEGVQKIMAKAVDSEAPARSIMLLAAMERSSVGEMPASWVEALGRSLASPDAALRERAVQVVRTRAVSRLDTELWALARNESNDDSLRLSALEALAPRAKEVEPKLFEYIAALLQEQHDAPLRQSAARLLARLPLSPEQSAQVTQQLLPEADALTFGSLLDAAAKQHDEASGIALVEALGRAKFDINRLPAKRVEATISAYPEAVRDAARPLLAAAEAKGAERVAKLQALVPHLGEGDVGRGRALFFGQKVACSTCHSVGNEGGTLGPDLTTIGVIRSGHDLAEAILFPSASIVQGYESWRIETEEASYVGILGNGNAEAVSIKTAANAESMVPRGDITLMEEYPLSIMPEGLDVALTQGELLDVLAFLQSLNNEQWLLPQKREGEQ